MLGVTWQLWAAVAGKRAEALLAEQIVRTLDVTLDCLVPGLFWGLGFYYSRLGHKVSLNLTRRVRNTGRLFSSSKKLLNNKWVQNDRPPTKPHLCGILQERKRI